MSTDTRPQGHASEGVLSDADMALAAALSVAVPTMLAQDAMQKAPGMLDHLRAQGFDVQAIPSNPAPVVEALRNLLNAVRATKVRPADQPVGATQTLATAMVEASDALAALPAQREPTTPELDVERLGFYDLLTIGEALLTKYPPSRLLCSHDSPDKGPRTTAAIADLIASCRAAEGEREEQGR